MYSSRLLACGFVMGVFSTIFVLWLLHGTSKSVHQSLPRKHWQVDTTKLPLQVREEGGEDRRGGGEERRGEERTGEEVIYKAT